MEPPCTDDTISPDALTHLLKSWEPLSTPEEDVALSGVNKLPDMTKLQVEDEAEFSRRRGVDVREAKDLSYEEFVKEYLVKNKPVVIRGCTGGWRCCLDWVMEDGKINYRKIVSEFPESSVQVTETHRSHEASGPCEDMTVSQYFKWWENRMPGEVKYLKDWHCAAESMAKKFYRLPHYFRDDWLNEYYDSISSSTSPDTRHENGVKPDLATSDYRFVYIGPKGSWTPLHSDVLRSYSWSTNVCGRKRWLILPPDLTSLIYDKHGRHVAPDFTLSDASSEKDEFPNIELASLHALQCIQGPQDTIFVPCSWHHSVENLEDTLSINHNWINGFSVNWTWKLMHQKYCTAATLIDDCRSTCSAAEFQVLVDKMVLGDCGMDFNAFFSLLAFIARRELTCISDHASHPERHLISLKQISSVLRDMTHFQEEAMCSLEPHIAPLIDQIEVALASS